MTRKQLRKVELYSLAHAAGTDVANRRMMSQGRRHWNEQDWFAACRETNRILDALGLDGHDLEAKP